MAPQAVEDAGWGQRMVGDVLGDVSGDVLRTAYQTRDVVRVVWKRDPRSRTEIKCFSICISPCNSELYRWYMSTAGGFQNVETTHGLAWSHRRAGVLPSTFTSVGLHDVPLDAERLERLGCFDKRLQ
jgi:hypothetical protein